METPKEKTQSEADFPKTTEDEILMETGSIVQNVERSEIEAVLLKSGSEV